MRILTRYVLVEFFKVFTATLAGTTILMLVVGVAFEARQQGIGLVETIRILPFILPEALRFAVPGTTLFAACSLYGRLSSANEVVAVKALGISPMVPIWPVLVLSVMLSVVSVWLNDVAVTWGRNGVQRVVIESVEQIAYGMLRQQRSYSSGSMAINVRSVDGRRLMQPTLSVAEEEGKPSITITADEADLNSDLAQGTLTIRFRNANIDVGRRGGVTWPGEYAHVLKLTEVSRKGDASGPSTCPMGMLARSISQQKEQISALEQKLAAEAACDMMTGNYELLVGQVWKRNQERLATQWRNLYRLQTERPRRLANGASCFFFVLVGIPLSIHFRRGEFLTNFFLCFFPILLLYYPLLMTGVDRAKMGDWWPSSVWLGNLILMVCGLWLMRKIRRY